MHVQISKIILSNFKSYYGEVVIDINERFVWYWFLLFLTEKHRWKEWVRKECPDGRSMLGIWVKSACPSNGAKFAANK